ncbi:Zcchc4 [Columba guinea]|nr:Zcchc4 [Columba guinea]
MAAGDAEGAGWPALLGAVPGAPRCPHGIEKIVTSSSGKMRRLHELIQSTASQEEDCRVRSLLLDIDFRYSQFYTEDEFCHYNMFNHYFFGGEAAHKTCRKFLHQDNGERLVMVTDPPFGGLVEALASSFKKLMAMWKETEKEGAYYSQIGGFSRNITVDYDNHALYKHGKTGRRQSPVRIFTNITPSMIVLPVEEGYR